MKYATCATPSGPRGARIDGDEVILLDHPDAAAAAASADTTSIGKRLPFDAAALLGPSLRPSKIVCVGLNYESHIREMGRELPTYPTLFAKFQRTLIDPNAPIQMPANSEKIDWEAELGIVIGRAVRHASTAEARDAIAGYTVVNDITMRDWQWRTPQWMAGKNFEGTTPVGPVIVTPDEIDHAANLEVGCEVNGETMQQARTSDLLFGPADLVAYISSFLTLEPGDLIATGTPGGVGAGRDPAVYLQPGDVVRTYVEGIGELVNTCANRNPA